jgi:hypothetical protein
LREALTGDFINGVVFSFESQCACDCSQVVNVWDDLALETPIVDRPEMLSQVLPISWNKQKSHGIEGISNKI